MLVIAGMLFVPLCFAAQSQTTGAASAPQSAVKVHRASVLIGSVVLSPQGEKLGTIDDLVIDPQTGRTTYMALSYGAILGFGGKLVALPWDAFTVLGDGKGFVLNGIDKETLAQAPGFDKANWPQRADPVLRANILRARTDAAPGQKGDRKQPGEAISATIESIDSQKGNVTLRTESGETVDLRVPAELLVGLQVGDAVEVKASGNTATAIHKKEETPQSRMLGEQKLPPRSSQDTSKSP
jgi:sporulation protein YlmC with PRC-barrel domain